MHARAPIPAAGSATLAPLLILSLTILSLATGCKQQPEVVVFHAASLSRSMLELSELFASRYPGERVRVEVSGSLVAARKVAELGMRADVIAAADATVIDQILRPDHAAWNLRFASNEVVLAHKDHSRHTDEVTQETWAEVVQREGVRLGRANPDTSPIGYRTLLVWQLEGLRRGQAQLPDRLLARCAPAHVVADESHLLGLLEARAVDYIFMYRSTAEEHHLKITALHPEVDLGDPAHAARYAAASVPVRMRQAAPPQQVAGTPILYGLTIPSLAPNPERAQRFVQLILGQAGRTILARSGYRPLQPPRCDPATAPPASLAAICGGGEAGP